MQNPKGGGDRARYFLRTVVNPLPFTHRPTALPLTHHVTTYSPGALPLTHTSPSVISYSQIPKRYHLLTRFPFLGASGINLLERFLIFH